MRLVRLTDDIWVNPDHVSGIWIDMHKVPDTRDFNYPVMVTCMGRTHCICVCWTREEANTVLFSTVQLLHMNANGKPAEESA